MHIKQFLLHNNTKIEGIIDKRMSTTPGKKITTEYQLSPGNFDVAEGSTRTSATVRSTMRGSIMDQKIIRHDGTSLCTKHTFEELENIENERRKILKRVSCGCRVTMSLLNFKVRC